MLLSQWWELEETAIRCKLGMWGKKWQAKKRQKKALPTCLPFFCPCIQSYSLTCCASFHQPAMEKGTLHSYTPVRSQPRHLRVSQGIPWSAHALGGSGPTCSFAWSWEAERRWEGGREASPRLRAVKALAHLSTAQSHRQAAAFLPRFAWSRYPHFSLLLVIYISRGQTPLHSAPFAACQTPIHSSQPLSSIVLKLPLAIFNCQNIYICHLHTKCIH